MVRSVSKVAYLDGIRGIAAFLVVLHHFLLAFYPAHYTFDMNASNMNGWDVRYGQSLLSVFSNGNFCVCIFFVLSGFVLSRKYFQTNDFEVIVSGVYRRYLRLYIPVAFIIILSFLMMEAGLFFTTAASKITHSEWWLGGQWVFPDAGDKLIESLKVGTMFQGNNTFDTSLWTMTVEFSGSLFVFAFLAFTHKTRHRFISLLLVGLYCKWTESVILSAFMFGISLNYLEQYAKGFNKKVATSLAVILLMMSLVLGSFSINGNAGTFFDHKPKSFLQYGVWFHVVGAYFMVVAFVISVPFQKLVSLRLFRFLGYISFAMYLLHPLIIGSFSSYVFLQLHDRLGFNHTVAVVFLLTVALCFILSWLIAKYIDEPGIRFSKYVYNRWFKKVEPQSASIEPEH